jgi:hypothetical protein
MSSYSSDHSSALSDVRDAGGSVTFTRITQTHTESTDAVVPTSSTISGYAIEDGGKGRSGKDGLVTSRDLILFFVASTYGDEPEFGDSVSWGGVGYSVSNVRPFAPNGDAIASYVSLA